MQTALPAELLATDQGQRADSILRSCVHCGFCNATCPTYQLLGDELDGPRGRIWLIRDLLETGETPVSTRTHLDRCLTCRACETTCPSGVRYGELLAIGREHMAEVEQPNRLRSMASWLLARLVPEPALMTPLFGLGRLFRPLLPSALKGLVPPRHLGSIVAPRHPGSGPTTKTVVLLDGCAQGASTPDTNTALAALLRHAGIRVLRMPVEQCCGALEHHLPAPERARRRMAGFVAGLWPLLEQNQVAAIVSSASGCGVHIKELHLALPDEPRAAAIAALTRDASEVLAEHLTDADLQGIGSARRIAWQPPCTLQHGQRITGVVEDLLVRAGFLLLPVADQHLCCGSAGTYSMLQPELSEALRRRKLAALHAGGPELIATANVGCQSHLQAATGVPVRHWVELLAEGLGQQPR